MRGIFGVSSLKGLFILAMAALAACHGWAQGTVMFQNTIVASVKVVASDGTTNRATQADHVVVGLFWGASLASATNLAAVAGMSTAAGIIAGDVHLQVPGALPGEQNWFTVAAWDDSYGKDAAALAACIAAGGLFGSADSSDYGVIGPARPFLLGPQQGPGTVIFGSVAATSLFHGFTMDTAISAASIPTPEPSTIALAGVALVALLAGRRFRRTGG